MTAATGVVCLEGDWDDSLDDRASIEPALMLLERLGEIRLIHRDVVTKGELEYYLNKWLDGPAKKKRFDIGYLGFHGSPNSLYVGDEEIPLYELARIIDGRCKGKVLCFGSCEVLAADDAKLREFCRKSGATAIAGYTRPVDWVESAAFELLLISGLAGATKMKPLCTRLHREYPDLTKRLGFRMATAHWSSDQQVALDAMTTR